MEKKGRSVAPVSQAQCVGTAAASHYGEEDPPSALALEMAPWKTGHFFASATQA